MGRSRRGDAVAVGVLLASAAFLLLPHALHAGLHLDDHGFHHRLSLAPWGEMLERAARYVPGRHLYILFYWLLYRLAGPSPSALHAIGFGLDAANVVLFYALLRQMRLPVSAAFSAAALFLVWPNHAETHFWTSAIAMNLLSTTFLLGAFLALGAPALPPAGRTAAALLLYLLALFDYDQAFFMWVPLLFYGWRLAPAGRPAGAKVFAAVCLAADASHALLRALAPTAEGGRPVLMPLNVPRAGAKMLLENLAPLRWVPDFPGPAAAAVLAVLALAWWRLSADEEEALPSGAWRCAAVGLLWAAAAYLPNLFWHVSPRHNYLPSAGLLLAAACLWRLADWPSRRWAAATALCGALFGAALLQSGREWAASGRLLEGFARQAKPLIPPSAKGVFLVGAPPSVGGAPAFKHPEEHLFLAYAPGESLPESADLDLTPTRAGTFLRNRQDLFGGAFHWTPWADQTVLRWEEGRVVPVCAVLVERPDGAVERVALAPGPGCVETRVAAPAWLSAVARRRAAATESSGSAAAPTRASAAVKDGVLTLTVTWRVFQDVARDFAWMPRIEDARGRAVFTPVYPPRAKERRVWPAFDDLAPPSTWRRGEAIVETYLYRFDGALPRPAVLRMALFERSRHEWSPDREVSVPLD